MCARLLACPLCSQPGFVTLDELRAGLVSVATRPLICPVCNEVLLGIDKLTIHLFSHTINLNNNNNNTAEPSKYVAPNEQVVVYNAHNVVLQDWNILKTQQSGKTQTSNDNNSTELSDSGTANIENNISIVNSQPQAQNQNLSVKSANQHSFMSDYNYDIIKVNIFPHQSNENHNVLLRPTTSLQQDKTDCTTQYFCNDNVKHLNVIAEDTQAEEAISNLITGTKVTESTDSTNIYQDIEREYESNSNQCVAKERLMVNLIEKEGDLTNFQSIQNIMPVCTNVSSEECNDKQTLSATRETEANAEYQDHNLEHRKMLSHTCTKVFRTITAKEKTERCNICGCHFPDTNILALHKQLVHEQDSNDTSGKVLKNYSCHLCSKVFKMRGSLMVHMRVAHVGHNSGPFPKNGQIELKCSDTGYTCPTCGKKFKKEQHVIQHLKTHEGKQWECDTCSKLFTTKYFLKKHKRLHSGEMPYKCKICDKSFTFQQSYHKHRFYHKDEKPHSCATCGRSFKELSTLHNHERIHTGEKPFACETCGKCFRQRVSYLVHRRIHTGVMPYKCTMCDKSFRYKVSQRTHKCPAQTSGGTQQFDTIAQDADDKAIRLQTNTFQEGQSTTNAVDNEKNKFVLIINAQGQHVLALQSEINNVSSERKEESMEFRDVDNTNKDSRSANNFNSVHLEESAESIKKIQSDNEKIDMKSTNDFFSMVMSPLESGISSPTFEMEHLRVSSPKHKENLINSYTNFPKVSDSVQMNTVVDSSIDQSFNRDKEVTDTLQTINEESLKELLYSMDRK